MSESKHTPGPWSVRRNIDPKKRWQYGHEIFGATARRLAITDSRGLFDEQDAANARLIAAAPEMLEEIVRLRRWIRNSYGDSIVLHPPDSVRALVLEAEE